MENLEFWPKIAPQNGYGYDSGMCNKGAEDGSDRKDRLYSNKNKINSTRKKDLYCNSNAAIPAASTHKARDYADVSEIERDLKEGAITPYGSMDEIIGDMSRGVLSPFEAILFVQSMKPVMTAPVSDMTRKTRRKSAAREDIDSEEDYEPKYHHSGGNDAMCYNPNGFVAEGIDDEDEWG